MIVIVFMALVLTGIAMLTNVEIKLLRRFGMTAQDTKKPGTVMVARPVVVTFVVMLGVGLWFMAGEFVAGLVVLCVGVAVVIGYIDDIKKIRFSFYKPLGLMLAFVPLVVWWDFDGVWVMVVAMGAVLVSGNSTNMMDTHNGVVSIMIGVASLAMSISLAILDNEMSYAMFALSVASLLYAVFHEHPAKAFPGDAGALAFGVAYAVISIMSQVEVLALVAIMPAVFNSFLYLISAKGVKEHRTVGNAITLLDDMRLVDSKNKKAPLTLVRLICAKPKTELEVIGTLHRLTVLCSGLAVVGAIMIAIA